MATDKVRKKGKKNRKLDRMRKRAGHIRYNAEHRREHNKLRRVRKHNGEAAAKRYLEFLYEVKGIYIKG